MAKRGNILYTNKNFTDAEVQQKFGFPCILILHDNASVIKKITAFDKIGSKTIYDFSLAATKDFVIQSIADAVAGLNDNILEFPTFADFPQPGEVGNIYIALDVDQIFVWNAESQSYVQQSWDAYVIQQLQTNIASAQMAFQNLQNSKLDKGTYTGTASDLFTNDQNLLQSLQNEQSARYYADKGLENSKQNKLESVSGNTGVGKTDTSATEKFDVNGNIKAIDFKGQSIKFNLQASITPTPNTLVPKTDGSGLMWYDNSSVGLELFTGTPFVYNVPSTITVNHVNAPASPDVPTYIQAIQDRLTQLNQPGVTMQKFTNWSIIKYPNVTDSISNVINNDLINTNTQPYSNDTSIPIRTNVVSIHTDKILPRNADWVLKCSIKLGHDGEVYSFGTALPTARNIGLFTGIVGNLVSPDLYLFDTSASYQPHALRMQSTTNKTFAESNYNGAIYTGHKNSFINVVILKVGDSILVQTNYGTSTLSEIYSASNYPAGDFGFCVMARKPAVGTNNTTGVVSNISYYIFP